MAGNKIEIDLSVQDKSGTIKQRTNEVKELHQELKSTKTTASNFGMPTGTQAGYQAMRASYGTSAQRASEDSTVGLQRTTVTTGFQRSGQQASRQSTYSPTQNEMSDYTIAGGVTGRGGAAARDFANQAQGLDGLVRLYAEYAARLFAASAAFTALRNAMDTDIMVRGMEQLSAASGTSLASMTKSFITASDGMISFREAAEAVTKATSSGMGREQVMQIAEVAKGASQALGLNMNDAVSRLTRGITKLEPELLDELGIFTKLDKAVTDYARTVGKSESALTDFERRQAFANAVLKEGRDKFSEIAQQGNPYDKLLASLKDVAQQMLSVVNTVITPIVKLFADNSTLIAGSIAIIATKIVSKAIPALGAYSEYLRKTAAASAVMATGEAHDAYAGQEKFLAKKLGRNAAQESLAKLSTVRVDIENEIESVSKRVGANYQQQLQQQQKILDLKKQALIIDKAIEAEQKKIADINQKIEERTSTQPKFLLEPWQYMKKQIADTAVAKTMGDQIKSKVVTATEEQGPVAAFGILKDLLGSAEDTKGMGKVSKVITAISSAFGILGQTILTVTRYLSRFIPFIGQAIALYEIYAAFFSNNTKEVAKFDSAIDQLNDTVKTATDVNDKYKQSMSIEAVLAYANSFNEITESVRKTADAYNEANQAAGFLDNVANAIKVVIPLWDSLEEKAAESTGTAVGALIKQLGNRPETEEYKKSIGNILGIEDTRRVNNKSVEEALRDLRGDSEKFAQVQGLIVDATEKANKKLQEQTLYLRGLKDAAQNAEKSATSFMNSLRDTSNLSIMMENNIKYLTQLDKALTSTDQSTRIAAVDSLKDVNFAAIFGEAAVEVARLSEEFEELQGPADAANKELVKVNKRIDELNSKTLRTWWQENELEGLKALKGGLDQVVTMATEKAAQIANLVSQAVSKSVDAQIEQTVKKYNLEVQKLGVEQAKFMASKAPVKTVGMIDYQAKLDKELVNIETQLLSAQYDLADSIDRLNSTIKQESDIRRKDLLEKAGVTVDGTDKRSIELQGINKRLESKVGSGGEMIGTSYQIADKFLEDFKSGKLKLSPQKLIEEAQVYLREFPEKLAQFDRILKNQLRKTAAANKAQQIDITATIDKINLTTQQAVEQIDNEIQSINVAISNIGSDTPARIQLAMDAANLILTKELDKIDLITQAKLDNLSKLKLPADQVEEQKRRIATEDKMARFKIEQAAKEKELENTAQKTLLVEKQKQDIIIKTAEAQKGLVIGEGLMFDLQRQSLDRVIRQAQDSIEIAELQKKLIISEKKLQEFESKTAAEGMTAAQLIQGGNLIAAVQEDKDALQRAKNLQGLRNRGVEAQNNYNNLLTQQKTIMAEFDASQERQAALDSKSIADRTFIVNKAEQQLNIQQKLGFLTDREIQVGQAAIAQAKLEIERDTELLNLARERLRIEKLLDLEKEKPQQFVYTEMGDRVRVKSDTEIQLESQLKGIGEKVDATKIKAKEGVESIQRDLDITPRMEKYSKAFIGFFDSMGDAIANWAATGKWNGKELVNSLIQDLLRYEMRLQMHALFVQGLKPLIGNFFSNLNFGSGIGYGSQDLGQYFAKGGAFDTMGSVPGYAKGGMFTNKVVDKPTFFMAAKGLGVMGEAGPEAIMPLRRDKSGKLGIMTFAQGDILPLGRNDNGDLAASISGTNNSSSSNTMGNTTINVHNYTGKEVNTQESTDARGNRRIEVTVGEMVGAEVSRVGGAPRQSINATYGLKPLLIRR